MSYRLRRYQVATAHFLAAAQCLGLLLLLLLLLPLLSPLHREVIVRLLHAPLHPDHPQVEEELRCFSAPSDLQRAIER